MWAIYPLDYAFHRNSIFSGGPHGEMIAQGLTDALVSWHLSEKKPGVHHHWQRGEYSEKHFTEQLDSAAVFWPPLTFSDWWVTLAFSSFIVIPLSLFVLICVHLFVFFILVLTIDWYKMFYRDVHFSAISHSPSQSRSIILHNFTLTDIHAVEINVTTAN